MDYKDRIIRVFAETTCERISKKVIRQLQKMTDEMQSGEDSGLKNVWEEICVQVRFQQSIYWDLYVDVIETFIEGELETVDTNTKQAIWLQTDHGWDWAYDYADYDDEQQQPPFRDFDIVEHILQSYVLSEADNWTNKRIENYLENYC